MSLRSLTVACRQAGPCSTKPPRRAAPVAHIGHQVLSVFQHLHACFTDAVELRQVIHDAHNHWQCAAATRTMKVGVN